MMIVVPVIGFITGTILGSLVKALADRSLSNRSFWGRSYCPHCKKLLKWYDLLPIISYLILGGKCRYCGDMIGMDYLLVEVVIGILIGFLFWQSSQNFSAIGGPASGWQFSIFLLDLIFKTFFITILAVLFLTDLKKMFIPDRIVLPAIVISIIFIIFITVIKVIFLYSSLNQTQIGQLLLPPHSDYFQRHALISAEPFIGSIISAILIAGFFMILIIVTSGKGMGGGDVKLGAFIGLGLSSPNSFVALMLAFLTGALISLILIIFGKKHFGQHIAFGPFLVLGALVTLFFGNQILDWYLHLSLSLNP